MPSNLSWPNINYEPIDNKSWDERKQHAKPLQDFSLLTKIFGPNLERITK